MQDAIVNIAVRLLRETADRIDAGNSNITEEEAMDIMSTLCHRAMSKEEACSHLNLSRSRFDDPTREGKLPKGRKRRGFKELVYYQDELDRCKIKK